LFYYTFPKPQMKTICCSPKPMKVASAVKRRNHFGCELPFSEDLN
jgi:hypothetical protein